jgi:ribonuclease HI
VGFLEALPHLIKLFESLPIAVLIQEAHLPVRRLDKARALVHRLLPAYSLFAGRPRRGPGHPTQIQVVTLVHVYMAARASLLDVRAQHEAVMQSAPEALQHAHFIKMSDPRSDTTLLLGNVYQFQATLPVQQKAMLELISRVIARWNDHADLILIGGDFNASCRARVGYVGSGMTRGADARLLEWSEREGLACAAPMHATWQSVNESRYAVLDCFFWRAKTEQLSIADAESFRSPDPRLDHEGVVVSVSGDSIGKMPPLEALRSPIRLKMDRWSEKRTEWQDAVNKSLALLATEPDCFQELERVKQIALDCARTVLGTTGGKGLRIIPHHSKEARRLKARLTLLRVVRREVHARKEQGSGFVPPSKAMRRVWDSGLWPQPASFSVLTALWTPQNQSWTENWLRMLRRESAMMTEEWHCLRRRELTEVAERDRLSAISRFYTGRELQRLLHPTAPAPHSPLLYTDIPDTVWVAGNSSNLAAFRAGLAACLVQTELQGSVCISGIAPADLGKVLGLAEQGGLKAQLAGQKRLVQSATDRLCAWEFDLAKEAKATRAYCSSCGCRDLWPVTEIDDRTGRSVRWWCAQCSGFRQWSVRAADYSHLPFCPGNIPRVPLDARETLRGAITVVDFEFLLGEQPSKRAAGQDALTWEMLRIAPDRMKETIRACVNSILTGEAPPPQSWMGGLICFILKKDAVLEIPGYRPVCLLDTTYKVLSAIITDRLYRLAERHGLLDSSQEGFRRLHSTQRQVQSLHWAIQEAAEGRELLFCCYLDFANAFNSVDHEALWRWLEELNIPDIDLLRSLYSGAYYQADLPYGRSAKVVLSRGQKQGDKSSPLLFGLVFNALLLALKATGVGHRTVSGLRAPARGFADDLVIVTGSGADMSRLLQVVSDFCAWSGMRIKREKSVATGFDFKSHVALPTEDILYEGAPLTGLAPDEAFAYLGVRASLVSPSRPSVRAGGTRRRWCRAPCLAAEKLHTQAAAKDIVAKIRRHQYLLCQMVPAMGMVATSRFRYSAPLVPWTDAELDRLHAVWLQIQRAAWRLPPGYPSAPLVFPSARGGCPVAHPVVHMIQALAKHIEQLVALPDELRETTIRKYKKLCDSCGCHNARELAAHLAEERRPRVCPLARLLRACGQLQMEVKLPACLSLGVAGRDTSWRSLLLHLRQKAAAPEASQELISDVASVDQAWGAIRRRFRRRGVRVPRQLLLGSRFGLVPGSLKKDPAWLQPFRRTLLVVNVPLLFPRLNRSDGVAEVAVHQALIADVIHGLGQQDGPIEHLFADERWLLVKSSAPRRSWLSVLNRNGFPCEREVEGPCRIDPVIDLTEIGQFADAARDQLMALVLWLAPSIRPCRTVDAEMVDRGPLAWAPVRLETENVEFDTGCLGTAAETHGVWEVTHKDSQTRIEREGRLMGIISQRRYRLLEAECVTRQIPIEYLCDYIPEGIAYVEKHESKRGFGSHQFWHGLKIALDSDGIIGCCPLMAPSSFLYSSWNGVSADWGGQVHPRRPVFDLLCASPEEQRSLCGRLRPDQVWFALSRRSTLDMNTKRVLERAGQVITVYKKGSRVAACKGSFRTGTVRAIQNWEDWCLWASNATTAMKGADGGTGAGDEAATMDSIHSAMMEARASISGGTGDAAETARVTARLRRRADRVRSLKQRADSICLTADGVVPLDLGCPSSREAQLGPAGTAYTRSGIVVATDGSLKKSGAMGAAVVAKDGRMQARSAAVFGQPSSIRPELTGIALALEGCPAEEDLSILTDSLSSMRLLRSMQRSDLPLSLYRHSVRQLLLHVVTLINKRAEAGRCTRFIKVRAHRGEPLNEAADAMAAAAAELDPARSVAMDLDPEAVHFRYMEAWVEWDARVREDLVQRAAEQCVTRALRPKRVRGGGEASPPTLPLTASWLLRPNQGRSTLGKVLGEMQISPAKKQVLQSIAGAFPCNAVLHKWGIVPSAACALCGHPAETQSHIQCLCPALKEARIRAHHNMAHRLWDGIQASTNGWVIAVEQTVAGLQGLPQTEARLDEWQRAWDEVADAHLEGEEELNDTDRAIQRKRPDAWAVNWDKRRLLILEFTRPNDRCEQSLHDTDALKTARYTPLRDRLERLLPAWEVDIQTYTVGIRGSHDPDRWHANLGRLGMTAVRADRLIQDMVSQALTELTDLYNIRYAALQRQQQAQHG